MMGYDGLIDPTYYQNSRRQTHPTLMLSLPYPIPEWGKDSLKGTPSDKLRFAPRPPLRLCVFARGLSNASN